MKLARRAVLGGMAAAFAAPSLARAQADWRAQHPVFNVAVVPNENQQAVLSRFQPLADYFRTALGFREVRLHTASDYAGIIEAMRARRVDLAFFGPAAYARAFEVTNGNTDPLVIELDENGTAFYHSVIVVRADSPFRTLEDLRGRTFAFVDPNSTSGFVVPNYFLHQQGTPAATYFGRTGFAGSHDNGALVVVNGQFDSAAVWWRNENNSSFHRMMDRNLIPRDSLRIVWTSPRIPESPWTARKDLPQAMRDAIRQAMIDMPARAPEQFRHILDGKSKGFLASNHDQFQPIIEMIRFNQQQRRSG